MRCLRAGQDASWGWHSPEPRHAGLLGVQAVVQGMHALADLIEQTGRTSAADRGLRPRRVGAVLLQHTSGHIPAQEPSRGLLNPDGRLRNHRRCSPRLRRCRIHGGEDSFIPATIRSSGTRWMRECGLVVP